MRATLPHLLTATVVLILSLLSVQGAAGLERVWLSREHVDLRIQYHPGETNELELVVRDRDRATNYASTNVVLVVREGAQTPIPPGFEQFGEPGSPLWILPASQDPGLLFLGISGEGIPSGVFTEPPAIRLREVRAPGWFFLWQFDPSGGLNMILDTRSGIGPDSSVRPALGGHGHYNWGFSSNGWYEVTFQVEGRLAGAATNLVASPNTLLFAVEPIPPEPPKPAYLAVVDAFDGMLRCQLSGASGLTCGVEYSEDLIHWVKGPVVVAQTGPVPFSVPIPTGGGPIFVRAVNR
ncbi:MAG: choice-of-anchor M domain-containing protein [Limisphaerales bacterium]